MSDEGRPWFPFYADAYMGDKDLEGVSCAAECMLVRMMALCHNGEPYGYLTHGGQPLCEGDIVLTKSAAVMLGRATVDELNAAVKELLDAGRIGFDEERRCFYVPKMVRIGEQREYSKRVGSLGGNPRLSRDGVRVRVISATGAVDWPAVKDRWNVLAKKHKFRQINDMTEQRRHKYRLRIAKHADFWEVLERELPLMGDFVHEGSWFGFEWLLLSDENYQKFCEGKYRDKISPSRDAPDYDNDELAEGDQTT